MKDVLFIDDFILIVVIQCRAWMFTWSLQSDVKTLQQIIKSPLRLSAIENAK